MSVNDDKTGHDVEHQIEQQHGEEYCQISKLMSAYEFEDKESVDITEKFIQECKSLRLGEMAMSNDFNLGDCMSSIELMDPKMDQGMKPIDLTLGLENAIKDNKVNVKNMPLDEVIATFDGTIANVASFLNANNLDQTIYTNILLTKHHLIEDETLKVLSNGLLQFTRTLKFIIDLGGISYDEDIVLVCKADETMLQSKDNDEVLLLIKKLLKTLDGKKDKDEQELAIIHRLKFLQHFFEIITFIVPSSALLAPDSTEQFVVNFKGAQASLPLLKTALTGIIKTINVGKSSPNGIDNDFSWLSTFQLDVNRHLIPNTFPRTPTISNRHEAYQELEQIIEKMSTIIKQLPLKVNTIDELLLFVRDFTASGADIFSRCLLQVVIAPFGDSVFGNISLNTLVSNSLQAATSPVVLDKNYPLYHSKAVQEYWQQVLSAISRSFLSLVQVYGMNETRQREQICSCLKEFNTLYIEAEHVDKKFIEYLEANDSNNFKLIIESKPFCLSAYIGQHLMELMRYYIVLGFKLELFVPYEYQYCYWYLGEVISMWRYRLFEQSREYLYCDLKIAPPNVDKKKFERKKKQKEWLITKRMKEIECFMLYERIDALLSRCYVSVSCGLVSAKHLEIPEDEKNRYSARFEPFAHVPVFARINHAQYSSETEFGLLASIPTKMCYERAKEALEMALDQLMKLKAVSSNDDYVEWLLPVVKNNLVVCRLLVVATDKNVKFEFSKMNYLYPILKLV